MTTSTATPSSARSPSRSAPTSARARWSAPAAATPTRSPAPTSTSAARAWCCAARGAARVEVVVVEIRHRLHRDAQRGRGAAHPAGRRAGARMTDPDAPQVVTGIHHRPRHASCRCAPSTGCTAEAGAGLVGDRYHGTRHRHVSVQSASELAESAELPRVRRCRHDRTRRNLTLEPRRGREAARDAGAGRAAPLLEVVRPGAALPADGRRGGARGGAGDARPGRLDPASARVRATSPSATCGSSCPTPDPHPRPRRVRTWLPGDHLTRLTAGDRKPVRSQAAAAPSVEA